MLEKTNTPHAQWRIIDTSDRKFTRFQVYNTLVSQITNALNTEQHSLTALDKNFTDFKLSSVDLSGKTLPRDKYENKLKALQKSLARIHSKLYNAKIPAVILFEGWDAAGKGGAIKRLATSLDPRGYVAVPVSAPELHEFNRHYLWRFWDNIPKTGHITIFDRSWYGRVMVEKIENITPEKRVEQAYAEINEFERELTESGVIIIKFWLQIDKDEQLRRFKLRESDPFKKWKITNEDWRNREKWDEYEPLIERMIGLTSTEHAPWNIIEANDKLFSRIKVLKTVEDRLDAAIKAKAKNRK
jgi:polyphosphate kinase 2 (PPK2 family)